MKNKSRIITIYIISILLCFSVSGCGLVPSIDLTDEQVELVSEYSAGILLKYVKGHKNGLMRVNELDFKELNLTPTPTPIPTEPPMIDEPVIENSAALADSSDSSGSSKDSIEITLTPMNEAFGLEDAELNFSYGEIVDTYPSSEEDLVFSMNAALGKDLLVLHFDLVNPNAEGIDCSTNLNGYKIRAIINQDEKIRSEITFLPNDLINYSNYLEAGESDDLVLVFEIEEGENIDSLNLLLVNGSDQKYYQLV